VPAGLSPQETIKRLRDQDAFISVSHPFDLLRKGHWDENDLLEIVPQVDAIEVYNSRCWTPGFNHQAREFADKFNLARTVGSDAHAAFELGRAVLLLDPFKGPRELRCVIRVGVPRVRWSPWWVHLLSRYASLRKKIKS